jgi:hypothetical protein
MSDPASDGGRNNGMSYSITLPPRSSNDTRNACNNKPPIPYRCWSVSYARYLIAFWAPLADSELMSSIVSRLFLYRFA